MKRRIWGRNAVNEALRGHARNIAALFYEEADTQREMMQVLQLAKQAGIAAFPRTRAELDAMARESRHQGVIVVSNEDYPYLDLEALCEHAPDDALLVAMEEVTDVGNMGAIVRSSVAFGAYGMLIGRHRTASINETVVRASAGATEHARIARVTNLVRALEWLHERDWISVGLVAESNAPALSSLDLRKRVVLVLGAEDHGIRRLVRERCSTLAHIPMAGTLGSLNVSVAAGISLYETARQRRNSASERT